MKLARLSQVLLGICALLYLAVPARAGGGVLKVSFLDVGQGDSIYIEAPNGRQMIIDGGPDGSLVGPLSEVVPFGDRSIDVIVVTNPDTDHYAGFLDMLDQYSVGAVIAAGTRSGTALHTAFQDAVFEKHIPEVLAQKGMQVRLDTDLTFTVLYPDRDVSAFTTNDGSIVGILQYGSTRIMFTGDATVKSEAMLLAQHLPADLKADILKVGHHGSTTSSSEAFVKAVAPTFAVVSVGAHNKYNLPKQSTIDTLEKCGAKVLRTDTQGSITFISDGITLSQAQ